jgi:hypothetical protein
MDMRASRMQVCNIPGEARRPARPKVRDATRVNTRLPLDKLSFIRATWFLGFAQGVTAAQCSVLGGSSNVLQVATTRETFRQLV